VADLHDRGDVEDVVDAAVAGPVESVPDLLAARGVEGRGAVPGGEPVPVGEAGHVADVGRDPRRSGRADPVHVHQPAAAGGHRLAEAALHVLGLAV
jgi:hypothetical protein